jgi:hypothetical protein
MDMATLRRWVPNLVRNAVTILAMGLCGCASVSPQRITKDRIEYGEVIADSWKRQTLMNVVRMRYGDTPVFLEVTSIINSYSVGGKANAWVQVPGGGEPNPFQVGADGSWSNTPTVTYQPLMGDRFTKSMLQPVPPSAIFQLLQGGWPAEMVLKTVATSINGQRNSTGGIAADEGFEQLIAALSRLQRSGGLSIRVEARKDGNAVVMVIPPGGLEKGQGEDSRVVQQLLGLEPGISEFDVSYGLHPKNKQEVAVLSRSMLEIMLQLGTGIDLPAGDESNGRALPGLWKPGDARAPAMVKIRSGKTPPTGAYASVPYRGQWYWIDDTDIASKRTFTFLMILFSLAETGQSAAAPIVTVPSR